MSTASNEAWRNRAERSIAQGALTNSKRPQSFVNGVYPTHLSGGRGAHVYCADTNVPYLDFICGLGSNLFGYGNEEIAGAVSQGYLTGAALSLSSSLEVECAELLKESLPWVQRVKWLKTGSDACSAAIRIARAATGRELVMSEGYHGWHDSFVSLSKPAAGVVPKDQRLEKYSDVNSVAGVAAVIVEPVMTDATPERREWLLQLQERCKKAGTWLILDEVITGYRWPNYSVSRDWGLEPDLICLGKAIGGGMPLAAVAGRHAKAMDDPEYFVSSTFAGDRTALAAFKAVHKMLRRKDKYDLEDLWERGRLFQQDVNRLAEGIVQIEGYPTRGVFVGDPLKKALFFQECCKARLLFGPSFFFGFQHREHTHEALATIQDVCMRINLGQVALEGEMPASPFAQKIREGS